MTILYKPLLIESVEQAEALPFKTTAFKVRMNGNWVTATKFPSGRPPLAATWSVPFGHVPDRDMIGWTALLPVEAAEQWGGSRPNGDAWPCDDRSHAESDADGWNRSAGPDGFQSTPVRRLATPWEEA